MTAMCWEVHMKYSILVTRTSAARPSISLLQVASLRFTLGMYKLHCSSATCFNAFEGCLHFCIRLLWKTDGVTVNTSRSETFCVRIFVFNGL